MHRSAENEKYPLKVTASSWLGDIPLSDLQIKHFAVWRDERGAEIKDNPARYLRVRGTGDARAPFCLKFIYV